MRSTKTNAVWRSQPFGQEAGQGNWKLLEVNYEEPKTVYPLSAASTSSVTLELTDPQTLGGSTVQMANGTDGEKNVVVSVASSTPGASWTSLNAQTTLYANSSPTEQSLFPTSTKTYGGIFNGDGTVVYRFLLGSVVAAFSCSTPYRPELGTTALGQFTLDASIAINKGRLSKDGTKFIGLLNNSPMVYVYDVTTPYDLTTLTNRASYDLTAFLAASWALGSYQGGYQNSYTEVVDIAFNNDGTKCMVMRRVSGYYNQYTNLFASATLTSAYDFSNYTNLAQGTLGQLSSSSQYYYYNSFDLSANGAVMVAQLYNNNGDTVLQRGTSLTTPWSAASNTTVTAFYSVSRSYIDTGSYSASQSWHDMVCISPATNGLHSFLTGSYHYGRIASGTNTLFPMATWDISAAAFTAAPTSLSTAPTNQATVSYITGALEQLTLVGKPLFISNQGTTSSLLLSNNVADGTGNITTGSKLTIDGNEYTAGTVTENTTYWSANYTGILPTSSSVIPNNTSKRNAIQGESRYLGLLGLSGTVYFSTGFPWFLHANISADGKIFYTNTTSLDPTVGNRAAGCIARYALSTPFDFDTATYVKSYSVSAIHNSPAFSSNYPGGSSQFSPDGLKYFYLQGYSTGSTAHLAMKTLTSPFDLDTASANPVYGLNLYNYTNNFCFTPDGKILFFIAGSGITSQVMYKVELGVPFDLSTAATPVSLGSVAGNFFGMTAIGNATNGYYIYGKRYDTNDFYVASMSGNQSWSYSTSYYLDLRSGVSGASSSSVGVNTVYQIIRASPCGTKLLWFSPSDKAIAIMNMPLEHFQSRYTVDLSATPLATLPETVSTADGTYSSLGVATKTSGATKNTYTYPATPIDARGIKFQVVGNTGADVSKLNADLYTE